MIFLGKKNFQRKNPLKLLKKIREFINKSIMVNLFIEPFVGLKIKLP